MGKLLQWQEECADFMREKTILESEYLYKLKSLEKEYRPKIEKLNDCIHKMYVQGGIIAEEDVKNGEKL